MKISPRDLFRIKELFTSYYKKIDSEEVSPANSSLFSYSQRMKLKTKNLYLITIIYSRASNKLLTSLYDKIRKVEIRDIRED